MTFPTSILTTEKFHQIEIKHLHPDEIKKSIKKRTTKDREKISHNTLLNLVVKSLGFKGGFSGYKEEYQTKLLPFLANNNLKKRADIYSFRKRGHALPLTSLNAQRVSERLFFSGQQLPQKIFTGYNFPFHNTISDGHYFVNATGDPKLQEFGIKPGLQNPKVEEHNLNLAKTFWQTKLTGFQNPTYDNRRVIDIVIGSRLLELNLGFNLLGDTLVYPAKVEPTFKMYYENSHKHLQKSEQARLKELFDHFYRWISESQLGWIEVIPYNDSLIFLKGSNGEYDFVFKNQKSERFNHNIKDGALKVADIPSTLNDYHFNRWLHFEYAGFREQDEHLAEQLFYSTGGYVNKYPGSTELLKVFHKQKHCITNQKTDKRLKGFCDAALGGKKMMVSQLISIQDLEEFFIERSDYFSYRSTFDPLPIRDQNKNINKTLPATMTWFDAIAYCKYMEDRHLLPFRLLKLDELIELNKDRKDILEEDKTGSFGSLGTSKSCLNLISNSDLNRAFEFKKELNWHRTPSGLKLITDDGFAEWVMEKTCLRTSNLKSFYGCDNILRSGPLLNDTGAYKNTKLGFRICYELNID